MLPASKIIVVSGLVAVAGLSGCTTLPSSGPGNRAVQDQAAVLVGLEGRKVGIDYALIDIDRYALPFFKTAGPTSLQGSFGGGKGGAPEILLGVGDSLAVSIFESSTGGLFVPADAGSRPGNFVSLPQQTVDRSGTITIPYAGRIKAAGRTPQAVQTEIESLLANRAIEPQVIVSVADSRSSQISVLGDVKAPSKLSVNPSGERILDVLARAGGIATPGIETYITLQRRGKEGTILFNDLVDSPAENIFVAPGDTIYVNRQRRTFTAFGASGLNGRIDFEETNLMLSEGMGKAGGLLDARADPAQVLLYRMVDRSILNRMKVDVSRFSGDKVPVIFRANLRDPAAFFAVKQFPMVDKDLLYITNSDSTEVSKFLGIVSQVTSPALTAVNVARN